MSLFSQKRNLLPQPDIHESMSLSKTSPTKPPKFKKTKKTYIKQSPKNAILSSYSLYFSSLIIFSLPSPQNRKGNNDYWNQLVFFFFFLIFFVMEWIVIIHNKIEPSQSLEVTLKSITKSSKFRPFSQNLLNWIITKMLESAKRKKKTETNCPLNPPHPPNRFCHIHFNFSFIRLHFSSFVRWIPHDSSNNI
jgi:hypothetical protein